MDDAFPETAYCTPCGAQGCRRCRWTGILPDPDLVLEAAERRAEALADRADEVGDGP